MKRCGHGTKKIKCLRVFVTVLETQKSRLYSSTTSCSFFLGGKRVLHSSRDSEIIDDKIIHYIWTIQSLIVVANTQSLPMSPFPSLTSYTSPVYLYAIMLRLAVPNVRLRVG